MAEYQMPLSGQRMCTCEIQSARSLATRIFLFMSTGN